MDDAPARASLAQTVEALYVVNKHAKQIGYDIATSGGNPCKSEKEDTYRKNALYELKHRVLAEIHGEATCVELHEIHDAEFYCFYFDETSFHVPATEFPSDVVVDATRTLTNFDPPHVVASSMPFEDALRFFRDDFGLDANALLDQRHVMRDGLGFVDIGWDCLDAPAVSQ